MDFVIGDVRVQPLGRHVVRIEQRGRAGFEDRETFTVLDRGFEGAEAVETRRDGWVCVATGKYRVVVPEGAGGHCRIPAGRGADTGNAPRMPPPEVPTSSRPRDTRG